MFGNIHVTDKKTKVIKELNNMKAPQEQFNPEQEAELTYFPEWNNGQPFVIRDIGESLLPLAEEIKAAEATAPTRHQTAVQPAQQVVATRPAYEDFNALAPREVLRRKINASWFDLLHKTNMRELLQERIDDDRNVAFARDLGLLSVTRCAKHEKAVSKLRGLTLN
jgi:hypothetical protein